MRKASAELEAAAAVIYSFCCLSFWIPIICEELRSLSFNGQFGKLTDRIEPRALSLPAVSQPNPSKGARSFVNFAYAEFHFWLLISMDSPLSRRMTGIDS